MSLNKVIAEVNQLKEALKSQTDAGTPQWEPSHKSEFALLDDNAFTFGVVPDPKPAPLGDASAPVAAETPPTPETDPQP